MLRLYRFFLLATVVAAPGFALAEDRLPAALIRLPQSVTTVFLAEIATAEFHRFDRMGDDIVYSGAHYMSIGQAGAGKQRSGDKRTPLGVYFVTERLDTSKIHQKYGVTAFPLDYPNALDLRANRSGDGIWVHGMDPDGGKRPQRDTDGCIALQNSDLSLLAEEFQDNVTPVLVMQELDWVRAASNGALRAELEHSVAAWVDSTASGDLHTYLSSYDDEFRRWGMDKAQWSSFTVQNESSRSVSAASVSELLLVAYPEEAGVYLSRFRLRVVNNGLATEITKRLYWRRDKHGSLKIIAEDDG